MASPRYCPRDFCAEPHAFGKAARVHWKRIDDPRARAQQVAARLQHRYAVRIRARAKASKVTIKELAATMGCSYPRLLRCLRGEIVMQLEDIGWAEEILGQIAELAAPAGSPAR